MWGPTSPPIHPTRFPSPTSSSKTHFHQDSLLKHHGCVIFLLVSWTVEWKSRRGESTPLTAEGRASGHPRTRGRAQGVRRNARGSESCRRGHAAAGARRGEPGDPGPGSEEPRAAACAGSEREPRAPAASGTTWDTEEKVRKSEGQARPGGVGGAGGASDAAAGAAAPADAAKGPSCSGCFALKTCDLPEATKGSYAREKRIISSPQELTAKSVGKSK